MEKSTHGVLEEGVASVILTLISTGLDSFFYIIMYINYSYLSLEYRFLYLSLKPCRRKPKIPEICLLYVNFLKNSRIREICLLYVNLSVVC